MDENEGTFGMRVVISNIFLDLQKHKTKVLQYIFMDGTEGFPALCVRSTTNYDYNSFKQKIQYEKRIDENLKLRKYIKFAKWENLEND